MRFEVMLYYFFSYQLKKNTTKKYTYISIIFIIMQVQKEAEWKVLFLLKILLRKGTDTLI